MFCGDGANSRIEIVDPIGQCRRVWARGSPRKMKVESGRTDRRLSGGLSDGAGCAVDVGCLLPSPHSIVIVNNMQHVRINIVSSPRYRSEGRPPNAWGRGCTLIERRVARNAVNYATVFASLSSLAARICERVAMVTDGGPGGAGFFLCGQR